MRGTRTFPLKDNLPTDRLPIVTILLIVANVLVYFFVQHGGITSGPRDKEVVEYGAIPYQVTHPSDQCGTTATLPGGAQLQTGGAVVCEGERVQLQGGGTATVDQVRSGRANVWLTLVTSMFLHGGILHLLGNMLFLWIFGGSVEDSMSRPRFVLFYLLGGLAAIGLQVLVEPSSTVPTIGASGAIAAVLGGYILLYPRARVVTAVVLILLVTLVELPAWLLLGVWFVEQAIVGATSLGDVAGGGGGVAYFAHVGGFVFGLLAVKLFAQRRKQVPPRAGELLL
jgi:membrane associated rhomboid family serine protease